MSKPKPTNPPTSTTPTTPTSDGPAIALTPDTFGVWFERGDNGYIMHVVTTPRAVMKAWTSKSYLSDIRAIVLSRCIMVLEDVLDSL